MISLVTDNRLMATATGTAVTTMVQSSTITTVIVVGLVNAGLMQLHQSVGVILGANIGTTITGWILVLKVGQYGLPLLGASALAYVFSRRDRPKFVAMALMGLGMIFFGLELMKDGFAPMKDVPMFVEAFAWFRADTYLGVLKLVAVGCGLTFLVQSSSATLAITIGLAATGAIPFTAAAALVLGENIGTTITVMIASVGANVNAKRTAYAHVLFNVFGVFWITLIFQWYVRLVAQVVQSVHGANPMTIAIGDFASPLEFGAVVTAGIALTHTGFNVTNTLMFLPFLKPYARLLERIVPAPTVKEVRHLKRLDARSVSAPVLGVEQSRGEVVQMGNGVVKMMDWIRDIAFLGRQDDERLIQKTFHREDVLDNIQAEITAFLTDILDATVPHSIAEEGRQQLRIAHEYESMSDRLASILRAYVKLRDESLELPSEQRDALRELHDEVAAFLGQVTEAYAGRGRMSDASARSASASITRRVKHLREEHLERMIQTSVSPGLSLIYAGLLTDYRRVRAHTINVHQAMTGERTMAVVD
jgi:phosphate:Na+ symporter